MLINYFMTWSSGNVKIDIIIVFGIFDVVMKIHIFMTNSHMLRHEHKHAKVLWSS